MFQLIRTEANCAKSIHTYQPFTPVAKCDINNTRNIRIKVIMEVQSRNIFAVQKSTSITYSVCVCACVRARARVCVCVCVCVNLAIQHAMRMRHIVICGPSRSTTFSHYLTNSNIFEGKKKLLITKRVF